MSSDAPARRRRPAARRLILKGRRSAALQPEADAADVRAELHRLLDQLQDEANDRFAATWGFDLRSGAPVPGSRWAWSDPSS